MAKLGVIINPVAGIGGRVGLKGSNGVGVIRQALQKGAIFEVQDKAIEALGALQCVADQVEIITYPGEMGENVSRKIGFFPKVIGTINPGRTTPADTIVAAKKMLAEKVNLIIFAGGDGTARDICSAVKGDIPVIGIPAGVKMHSAVFGVTPKNAGHVAVEFLTKKVTKCLDAEVMDIDEEAYRAGRVISRLYGTLRVPDCCNSIQNAKTGSVLSESETVRLISHDVVNSMKSKDIYYIVGPGSTTQGLMETLDIDNTLIGVDVIQNKQLVASDVDEQFLLKLSSSNSCKIIVSIIGGQGFLFGRGNQQLSPKVIWSVGIKNIVVVASEKKLLGLKGCPLLVDTGDNALNEELSGFIRVVTGPRQYSMCKIGLEK